MELPSAYLYESHLSMKKEHIIHKNIEQEGTKNRSLWYPLIQ